MGALLDAEVSIESAGLVLEGAVDRRSVVFGNSVKHALHVVFFLPLCRRNVDRSRMGTSICWKGGIHGSRRERSPVSKDGFNC